MHALEVNVATETNSESDCESPLFIMPIKYSQRERQKGGKAASERQSLFSFGSH